MADYKFQPAAPIPLEIVLAGGKDLEYIWPNGPSRCTWNAGADPKNAPHLWQSQKEAFPILPNVLHHVGSTPLIRLNNIPKKEGIQCEILAKCEFFNPGGSVKDRIALRMVEDAEKRGLLKPGVTIIEATSGNTGIGIAMAAAVKGYRCIIVMPLKMSNEKVDTLKALGAEIIRTPTAAGFDHPDGLISVAQKLSRSIPNSIVLDQYRNAFNPIAHYEYTATEILEQCGGKVDAIVLGAGTGGTITGIGRKIKEVCPNCLVIAADPLGSSLALPEQLNKSHVTFYEVEGIGYDFIPTVLDRSVVDHWYKTSDTDSLPMARRLIREEGLLCGASSGSAMHVALEVAKSMPAHQRLVVLLPDGTRNYMTKFISDTWMEIRQFKDLSGPDFWWSKLPVSSLPLTAPKSLSIQGNVKEALALLKETSHLLILGIDGAVKGVLSNSGLLASLTAGKVSQESGVEHAVVPVRSITPDSPLKLLSLVLEKEQAAYVPSSSGIGPGNLLTTQDLLSFISNHI